MKHNRIKKYTRILLSCLVLLIISSSTLLHADNDGGKKKADSITLDWEEFRSILKLDEDMVRLSWDEFTKISLQIDSRAKCEYRVENGDVILTREQFKKLLGQMLVPKKAGLTPPCDYLITKGIYNGIVGKESTRFKASLDLEIFKQAKKKYSKIPLFREELAIEEILFDKKVASIITEGGWHYLSTDEVGKHTISVKFSVKSSLDKKTPGLNFNIPQTPITSITLDIPKTDIDITINGCQELKITKTKSRTVVKGYLIPSSQIHISWRKKFTEIARGPAKIYAELFNLLSIEADAIRVRTNVKLNIVQNKIVDITLVIPSEYQVLEVTGQGKIVWNVREEKEKSLLDISFEYPIEGNQNFIIRSEKLLPEETIVADFCGFEVLKSDRESGFIAGEVKSDAEADVQEFENLDRVDFQKIPSELSSLSSKPIFFIFKYIRHPYNIVVDITKYEKEEVLTAIIDSARGVTLFNEEGKLIHQFTFSMRNLWSQFLKLELPEDSSIWSVYVDGKREKASKDLNGKILIPLARSRRITGKDGLTPFDVEIIYTEPVNKLKIFGKKEYTFPSPNVLISTLEWKIYLPVDYKYFLFGGNLKRKKTVKFRRNILSRLSGSISDLKDPSSLTKQKRERSYKEIVSDKEPTIVDELTKSFEGKETEETIDYDRSDLYGEKGIVSKPSGAMLRQKDRSLGIAGLLSVRVNIPISGKDYLFSKKIIEKGEDLRLSFTYMNEWIINALLILLVLIFLYIIFKIRKIFIPPIIFLGKLLRKLIDLLKKCMQPKKLPIVLFLILVIIKLLNLYKYHPLFTLLLIFLFILSLARLLKNQLLQGAKFLWHPSISLLITFLLLMFLITTRLFLAFIPLFLLLFIGFIVSAIRLIIHILKKRKKKRKEENTETTN